MTSRADELRAEVAERELEMQETAEREALEAPPDYDHKLPMSMDKYEFNHWCANGKRPTAPMRRQELARMAERFDTMPIPPAAEEAPRAEQLVRCACPQCKGRLVPRGVPMIHATRDFVHREVAAAKAAAKEDARKQVRAMKRELLKEVRAEIRRSMNADDNIINLQELRRRA
jgi:hypothetical protein